METPPLPAANLYVAPQPPPIPNKDESHLKTLEVFHYVVAAMSVLGLGFIAMHYAFMNMFFGNAELWKQAGKQAQEKPIPFNPEDFFNIFKWFYLVFGILILVKGILTLISGRFISQRKNRLFSLIISGLNCLSFPGIVLGIFTLVVLLRESVMRLYAEAGSKPG